MCENLSSMQTFLGALMDPASSQLLHLPWLLFLLATPLAYALWKMLLSMWLRPLRIKRVFHAQGIKGLPSRFIYGNQPEYLALTLEARSSPMPQLSHDIAPRILPYYFKWSEKYGKLFYFWLGNEARIVVPEPEQAREILSNKFGHFKKSEGRPDTKDLIGDGLATSEGEKWAQHRRIVSPAFFIEKLKAMTPTIVACAASMLDKWDSQVEEEELRRKEIDVHVEFRTLTADIIAHTAFGSSYAEGKQVFQIQHQQQLLLAKVIRDLYIPGSRFLPTSFNRYRWKIDNQIQKILRKMIESRMEASKVGRGNLYENDLLGLMMSANKKELQGSQKNLSMGIPEIIDECKTFFFAGHETTSTLLTWTLLLLATNPEWQERTRAEVLAVCGKAPPNADSLNHLKIVGMVLNEALRLYPPAVMVVREAFKDMKVGNISIPERTSLMIPIIAYHHDPEYWGPDAQEFNPQRFADGIAKACKQPVAYMPFGLGPRNCVGQTFALLEAKVVLSMILQRFSFHLSPAYKHAPTTVLTLQPQYGMQIIFERLAFPH